MQCCNEWVVNDWMLKRLISVNRCYDRTSGCYWWGIIMLFGRRSIWYTVYWFSAIIDFYKRCSVLWIWSLPLGRLVFSVWVHGRSAWSLKRISSIILGILNLIDRWLRLISEKFSNRGMLECIHSLLIFFLQSTSTAEHWKAPGGRENLAGLQHWPLSLGNTWTYGLRFPT